MVKDSLGEEGGVADDAEKGSIPIQFVNHDETEVQKNIGQMTVFDVVRQVSAK